VGAIAITHQKNLTVLPVRTSATTQYFQKHLKIVENAVINRQCFGILKTGGFVLLALKQISPHPTQGIT
jgi:hypothetical protein